jgi:hypothetical protein
MMQATGDSSFAANARTCFRRITTLDPRACPGRGVGWGEGWWGGGGLASRVASLKSPKVNNIYRYILI